MGVDRMRVRVNGTGPIRTLAAVGAVLLWLGLLAGAANREMLDGARFAAHVDAVRMDQQVAARAGEAISRQLLAADPDLIAVRPLLEAAATSLVGSPAFGPVVRLAARQAHQAVTNDDPTQIVLRLADLGVVLSGVLRALAPDEAAKIPPDLDLTLAQLGARTPAAQTLRLVRTVGLLSWLLPLLALLSFAAALWSAADRRQATVAVGRGVLAAGLGVGVLAVAVRVVAAATDPDSLRGAVVAAALRAFGDTLWWVAAIPAAAGLLLAGGASGRLPRLDRDTARRVLAWLNPPAPRPWVHVARGGAALLVGLGLLLRPALVAGIAAVVAGVLLVVGGTGELTAALGPVAAEPARPRLRLLGPRWRPAVATALVGLLGLLAIVGLGAIPTDRQLPVSAADAGTTCNGHVELCARSYTDVAFPATHNAMAAADAPGWFIPEQPTGLVGQLDAGIRVLLVDTWYGQRTDRPGAVATAVDSRDAALAQAMREFGPATVQSALRIRDAVTLRPTGPPRPYLCHGLCEIGATELQPELVAVRAWLDAHPREVVTFVIEDNVAPADTAAVFDRAGLTPLVHTQQPGRPWPTLGQMVDSGRRVVVMMERHGGGTAYPWLLPAFTYVQDTPFTNPTAADLRCDRLRGTAGSPLLLVNYWLANFQSLVTDARKINALPVLAAYLARCRHERGMLPNFVAVNYFDEGGLFRAVDQLNGVS
ncbi:MAG TPA: hypothetical protein VH573_21700 [Mycobacteriales bacterium]